MIQPKSDRPHNIINSIMLGAVTPGGLPWVGPKVPKLPLGWRNRWRAMRPRKFRWGPALILAIFLFLLMGECGPSASVIPVLP
jgi:hypothetical protein